MSKQLTSYREIELSLVGFNGTTAGRSCKTGPELVKAWRDRQSFLGRGTAIRISAEHWHQFYRTAWKLIDKRKVHSKVKTEKSTRSIFNQERENISHIKSIMKE
jgi:hypothetical protein